MFEKRRSWLLLSLLVVFIVYPRDSAHAELVSVSIVNQQQVATPGEIVVFNGILSNTTAQDVTIFGDEISIKGTVDISYTKSLLLTESRPTIILSPFETTEVIPLFEIGIPSSFNGPFPGTVFGDFYLSFNFQSEPFLVSSYSIVVQPPGPTPIPEPATMILFGFGLGGIAFRRLRGRIGG